MKVELSVTDAVLISGLYGNYHKMISDLNTVPKDQLKEFEETFMTIMKKIYDSFSEEDGEEFERMKASRA